MATGIGQVGTVGVEVLTAHGAVVLRVGQDDLAGPPGREIAEVVEGASEDAVAVSTVATMRARSPPVVAAARADLGLGQILDAGDPLGGIRQVLSGSGQSAVLLGGGSYRRIRRSALVGSFPSPVAVLETQL
jgi:hypothetical protein